MELETILIGLLLALIFISVTGYYPGGIIVPGYMALFMDQPLKLAGTFLASIIAFAVYRFVSNYTILFGKRRFVLMILLGALSSILIWYILPLFFPASFELRIIGWVLPGLIANNFDRQGVLKTTSAMIITIAATFFVSQIYNYFFQL